MSPRLRSLPDVDPETIALVEAMCAPDVTAERLSELRDLAIGSWGPFAEPMLRPCGIATAAQREGASDDARQLAVVTGALELGGLAPGDRVLGWSIELGNVILVTRRIGPIQPTVSEDSGLIRDVTRDDVVGLAEVIERVERL